MLCVVVWWVFFYKTSFCSYFLPFRVLILHILVLVVFAMLANNNWLPEDNGRKVTSLEAQTPFCHIFFREKFIHEEILYITEQSQPLQIWWANYLYLCCLSKGCWLLLFAYKFSPSQWEKNIVKKFEEKITLFFFGFLPQIVDSLFLQLLFTCWISKCT
jgi:hypothetical protein